MMMTSIVSASAGRLMESETEGDPDGITDQLWDLRAQTDLLRRRQSSNAGMVASSSDASGRFATPSSFRILPSRNTMTRFAKREMSGS